MFKGLETWDMKLEKEDHCLEMLLADTSFLKVLVLVLGKFNCELLKRIIELNSNANMQNSEQDMRFCV